MKNKIEILALIDRSGSMSSIMHEAVGAFNSFIEEQKNSELDDDVRVTLASFDDRYEVLYDSVKLSLVKPLTVADVKPRGMTSLHDSIGKLITNAKHPERDTIVLIQTDGYENSSREFNGTSIKSLIAMKEDLGWDINFIGAGIDAVAMGNSIGIAQGKAFSVDANARGMENFGCTLSAVSGAYRAEKFNEKK